jgi:hypothetical protein
MRKLAPAQPKRRKSTKKLEMQRTIPRQPNKKKTPQTNPRLLRKKRMRTLHDYRQREICMQYSSSMFMRKSSIFVSHRVGELVN